MEELETFKNQMLVAIKEAKEKKSADSQKEKSGLEESAKVKIDELDEKKFQPKVSIPSLAKLEKEEKESLESEIEKIKKGSDFVAPAKKKELGEKEAELEKLLKEIKGRKPQVNSQLAGSKSSNHRSQTAYNAPLITLCGTLGLVFVIFLIFSTSRHKPRSR